MKMFEPKVIEKEFFCKAQHSKEANFVILSSELSTTQRFLCQSCAQQYSSNIRMVECGELKYLLDNYQREKIKQFDSIFLSNIWFLEQFNDKINSLKRKMIEQLDSLLSISKKTIQMLIEELSYYSFCKELEKLLSNKIYVIDCTKIVETMKTILLDWNFKVNLVWDQLEEGVTMKKDTKLGNGQIFLLDLRIIYRYFNKVNIKMGKKLVVGVLSQAAIQKMKRCKNYSQWLRFSGGGSYDQEGEGIKIGKWVEIYEGYSTQAQIIYDGEYKNGKKVARWKIKHRDCAHVAFNEMQEFFNLNHLLSGGGAYDEQGIKIGNWTDISDQFQRYSQILWKGQYENGKKKEIWTILYQRRDNTNQQEIGGGLYDQDNYGLKHGKWIQLSEGFSNSSQLIHKGEYKNGQKVGQWETCFRERIDNPFLLIGQGFYDYGIQSFKNGIWIEPNEAFWDETQIIQEGKYCFGQRTGVWVEKKRARGNVEGFQNFREIVYDD